MTGLQFAVGDRVIRATGRTVVGVIERIHRYPEGPVARVRWEKSLRLVGGDADSHSTIALAALRLATDERVAVRKERQRQPTPMMRRAVAVWRERVGVEWAAARDVYGSEEEALRRAFARIVAVASWPRHPEAFDLFEHEMVEVEGRRVHSLRYRLKGAQA